ncbi:sigma-54 dependent transcriptional regulator [soil metagenome]
MNTKANILLIDDEEKLRTLMGRIIKSEGFDVVEASDCKSGLKRAEQQQFDVILCDVKLPDGSGVDLIEKLKKISPITEIILLTAYGNIPDGVQAIKNGAFDYITKGDDNDKILPLLYKAVEKSQLQKRINTLEKQVGKKFSFDSILGKAKSIKTAIELAQKVACTDTTVLLTGETGTGKEVFAQSIHNASNRNKNNFVAINCSAFSKDLLEGEMFGHKAGAFTGALKDQKGLFEEANNGTIFLDEIGEMAMDIQSKLLRVIETGEFLKVGETKPTKTNARIIAATNREFIKEIEAGNFRQDLFYRLSVFQIKLPALRERANDIEMLADYFLKKFAVKTNKKIPKMTLDFIEGIKIHQWPGNIRELKNVMERCVILCNDNELSVDDLPVELQSSYQSKVTGKILSAFDLASAEKLHIQKVMNYTGGNKTETARLLNIALTTLYRKLEEYKII